MLLRILMDDVLRVKDFIYLFFPNEGNIVVARQFNFCFIWPLNIWPEVFFVSRWAFAKAKRAFVGFIWRSGVLLDLHPWNPAVFSVRWTICLETLPPAEPRFTRMALMVILGFFVSSASVLWDFPPRLLFLILCTGTTGTWKHLDMALYKCFLTCEQPQCCRSSMSSFVFHPSPQTNCRELLFFSWVD